MQQMIEDLLRPSVTSSMSLGHLPLTRRAERIIKNSYIESKKLNIKKQMIFIYYYQYLKKMVGLPQIFLKH